MKPPVLMTQSQYAAHRGVSKQAVSQMKQRGHVVMVGRYVDQEATDRLLEVKDHVQHPLAGLDEEPPPLLLSKSWREHYAAERERMRYEAELAADSIVDEHGRKLSKRIERAVPELDESDEHLDEVIKALVEAGFAQSEYERGYADGLAAAVPSEAENSPQGIREAPPAEGVMVRFPDR